jgi:oxygen-independent coproporphyrinogen-3 oxidase
LDRWTPYAGYAYSYPHKSAYRPLAPPVPLGEAWSAEPRDALFLYLHVPFCEMRCGFCNLFTTANPADGLTRAYLAALARQAARVRAALGDATFARAAIGGGTPTFLEPDGLHELFDLAENVFGVAPAAASPAIPISVETSPKTADRERLTVLRDRGVTRVSIGVQSLIDSEVAAVGRTQRVVWVEGAIERIRELGFPTLNVDLMYGLPGQTVSSWIDTLRGVLRFAAEEIYLYPLYVRPLTGLGRRDESWDEVRLDCYRAGRDLLLDSGYRQLSMRMFRADHAPEPAGPVYCCQDDGMVGVGCGARSYTRDLHYSTEYAVAATGVRQILTDYLGRPAAAFGVVDYGVRLSADDQRRRWLIKSLLRADGLDLAGYTARFGGDAITDFPELSVLESDGLIDQRGGCLCPTAAGLEQSDAIGPWLYSAAVRRSMAEFEWH